jgi:hypothetical protein
LVSSAGLAAHGERRCLKGWEAPGLELTPARVGVAAGWYSVLTHRNSSGSRPYRRALAWPKRQERVPMRCAPHPRRARWARVPWNRIPEIWCTPRWSSAPNGEACQKPPCL